MRKFMVGMVLVAVLTSSAVVDFSIWQNRNMPTGKSVQSVIQANTQSRILSSEYPTERYFLEYTIQPADTLGLIALKHNTTINDVLAANKTLTTNENVINAGEKILIPISVNANE
jgi:LysM repeat protein